jgi:hypothetical protein
MTLGERSDQIIKLIDEMLSEVAVTQTATPTIPVGPYAGLRHGRQEIANGRDEMMQTPAGIRRQHPPQATGRP